MSVRVVDWRLRGALVGTRIPFRFGIAEMTELVHAVLFATVEVDGERATGLAADNLAPKWFTKNPKTSYAEDVQEMVGVIEAACEAAVAVGSQPSVFALWRRVESAVRPTAGSGTAPLLAAFGASFVERAAIDAFCRASGVPFARAVRENLLGLDLGSLHAELAGVEPRGLLPARPLTRICVRHTVGLADTLASSEGDDPGDGLPATLEDAVLRYGLRSFKVKVKGDPAADRERLARVAAVLDRCAGADYRVTLDGNEQYPDVATLCAFWDELHANPAMAALAGRIQYVEQPLARDRSLGEETAAELAAWPERPPLIVDEADDTLDAVARALAAGYDGAAFKSCKGVFKGLGNACLLEARRRGSPQRPLVSSAEDLSTIGPVGLLADLAVIATLGIDEPERNGHHYLRPLPGLGPEVDEQTLRHHGDLFEAGADGRPALAIRDGAIEAGSVVEAPFGVGWECAFEEQLGSARSVARDLGEAEASATTAAAAAGRAEAGAR